VAGRAVTLVAPCHTHADALATVLGEEGRDYLGIEGPVTPQYLAQQAAIFAEGSSVAWTILYKAGEKEEVVGWVEMYIPSGRVPGRSSKQRVSVGSLSLFIGHRWRRRGIGRSAAMAALGFAFDTLRLEELTTALFQERNAMPEGSVLANQVGFSEWRTESTDVQWITRSIGRLTAARWKTLPSHLTLVFA